MHNGLLVLLVLLVAAGLGCGGKDEAAEMSIDGGDGGSAGSKGGDGGSGDVNGGASDRDGGSATDLDSGFLDGIANPCGEEPIIQPVDWEEKTEMGPSAADVFEPVAGTCQALLTWDGTGFVPNQIEPGSGQSEVSVVVEIQEQSARLVQPQPVVADMPECEPYLEVEATVQLQTADGTFDETGEVTFRYSDFEGLQTDGFRRDATEHGGSLLIAVSEGERATLVYNLDGAGASCAGEITLQHSMPMGEGSSTMVVGGGGLLAVWSSTGCSLGQIPVNLPEFMANGELSLLEVIDRVWGDVSYPAIWDDGQSTELSLQVDVEVSTTCAETLPSATIVEMPVSVVYGTADGRLEDHRADAELRAAFSPEGTMRGMDLWLNDTLQCADESDTFPYTLGACTELEGVDIQLRINYYGEYDGGSIESAEGLNAYEYHRRGTAPPGAAELVRTLTLSPGD